MEELVLNQIKLLPESLQLEVLRYVKYLIYVKNQTQPTLSKPLKPTKLTFSDFHFPDKGQSYSRSEIYGDDGR